MATHENIDKFTRFLNKRKLVIVLLWLAVAAIVGVLYSPNFLHATSTEFNPPDGSEAAKANALLETYFPDQVNVYSHLVLIHNPDGSVLTPELQSFTLQLAQKLQAAYPDTLEQMSGYYIFAGTDLDAFAMNFVSEDTHLSFIAISFSGDFTYQKELVEHIRKVINGITTQSLKVYLTGSAEVSVDTDQSIERDLSKIDSIVIPIVFLLLLFLLRNYRYFPLTVAPILLTIILSFGVLERIITITGFTIQSFVPSVMISLTLGIGVDYNLFLLTRFREERKNEKSVYEATQMMMRYAGHTVLTSGLTLGISLIGLTFFPVNVLSSVGVAISVAVLILLLVNLTLTPSLLLLFGNKIEPIAKNKTSTDNMTTTKATPSGKKANRPFGIWYKIGKFATKRNFLILIIILGITLPLSFQVVQTTPESQIEFFAPRHSDTLQGFQLMQDYFGPGIISPLKLVIVPEAGNLYDQSVYTNIQSFIIAAIQQTNLDTFNVNSYTWLGGAPVNYSIAMAAITPSSPIYDSPDAQLYRQFSSRYLNTETGATFIEILLPVDAYASEAQDLLHDLKVIAQETLDNNMIYGFSGLTATINDTITETFDLFPLMIMLVVIAIYVFIGIMFGAAILPARLILTIALTISFIYGATTVLFEYTTILNSLFPLLDEVTVTFWMVPVMSFSIIVGLGIDYDVFTIERIRENAWNGLPIKEAISQGLDKTGRIITGAGLIMMIAFGGMMFSNSFILIQFGFVLSFAVFLDTFFVRSFLVPAIMSFGEEWNWWPSYPPHLAKSKETVENKSQETYTSSAD